MRLTMLGSKVYRACLVLFATAALLSCGTLSSEQKSERDLLSAIDAYNTAFRWENYKAAFAWIPPAAQTRFWEQADAFHKSVRILEFEVRDIVLQNQGSQGVVMLNCRFYLTNSPSLQSKTIRQTWQYAEKEKKWQVLQDGYSALMPSGS